MSIRTSGRDSRWASARRTSSARRMTCGHRVELTTTSARASSASIRSNGTASPSNLAASSSARSSRWFATKIRSAPAAMKLVAAS
jgi:hypothetical protein